MSHLKTHPICSNNTSCTSNNTKRRTPCNENGHGCCQACLPCVTGVGPGTSSGPTLPPDEAAVAKCDFLNPNTQSMHVQSFPSLCTNPIGCTELCCSDALGSDAVQWLWSAALKWLRTQLGCCNGCYQD